MVHLKQQPHSSARSSILPCFISSFLPSICPSSGLWREAEGPLRGIVPPPEDTRYLLSGSLSRGEEGRHWMRPQPQQQSWELERDWLVAPAAPPNPLGAVWPDCPSPCPTGQLTGWEASACAAGAVTLPLHLGGFLFLPLAACWACSICSFSQSMEAWSTQSTQANTHLHLAWTSCGCRLPIAKMTRFLKLYLWLFRTTRWPHGIQIRWIAGGFLLALLSFHTTTHGAAGLVLHRVT